MKPAQPGFISSVMARMWQVPSLDWLRGDSSRGKVGILKKGRQEGCLYVFFELPDPNMELGLPVGLGVRIWGKDGKGAEISRVYHPISKADTRGHFIIMDREENDEEEDPMINFLEGLKDNQLVEVSGPVGELAYLGGLTFHFAAQNLKKKFAKISFIAHGLALSKVLLPILTLDEEKAKCALSLLYSAVTEDDFVMSGVLDGLEERRLLNLHRTVEEPPEYWEGFTGPVSLPMIAEALPQPGEDHLVVLAGPEQLMKEWVEILSELGFLEREVICINT